MSEKGFTSVPAPTVTSRRMQLAPMRTPSPRTTRPSKMQFTSMETSRPHSSVAAHVDARRIGEGDAGFEEARGFVHLVDAAPGRRARPCC